MIVLDTHAWIWWAAGSKHLGSRARRRIRSAVPDVELVALTPEIAVRAAGLGADFPGDPADRLIVATALESRSPLATKDDRLRRSGTVETVW